MDESELSANGQEIMLLPTSCAVSSTSDTLTPCDKEEESQLYKDSKTSYESEIKISSSEELMNENEELAVSYDIRKNHDRMVEEKLQDHPIAAKLAKGFFFDISELDLNIGGQRSFRKRNPVVKEPDTENLIATETKKHKKPSQLRVVKKKFAKKYKLLKLLSKDDLILKILESEETEKLRDIEIQHLRGNFKKQIDNSATTKSHVTPSKEPKKQKLNSKFQNMISQIKTLDLEVEIQKDALQSYDPFSNPDERKKTIRALMDLKVQIDSVLMCLEKEGFSNETSCSATYLELNDRSTIGVKRSMIRKDPTNKKLKKSNHSNTVKEKIGLELNVLDQKRKQYLEDKQELFNTNKNTQVSKMNSFFVRTLSSTCYFLDDPETFLHFANTLVEEDRVFTAGEHENVDVVISALYPDVKETYVIFGNVEAKGKNGHTVDSLRDIYDIFQLNNIIYFNEGNEEINQLLFEFYESLLERQNKLKYDHKKVSVFKTLILKWNKIVCAENSILSSKKLLENANHLYLNNGLPLYFMKFLSNYIYGRIVLPEAKKLTKYKGFSDKTYGELMSDFLTLAFDKCEMNSESNYVDLGSGVGNTNFFASLSYNVKTSFGCEIMDNPSDICLLYLNYFAKILQLFGIDNHTILEFDLKKSFMDNESVIEKLKTCNILLLNNFIFSPEINIEVTKLVTYLPIGAKVIHLKPLQTLEKQNTSRKRKQRIRYSESSTRELDKKSGISATHSQQNQVGSDEIIETFKASIGINKIITSRKYQMPSGDMVSWTTNNNHYNYFISKISSWNELDNDSG